MAFGCGEQECLLCGANNLRDDLTDEHVFPASIGGDLIAHDATCSQCNGRCSSDFEGRFLNSVKILSHLLGIANREGNVPSINVVLRIDGRPFRGVLHDDGELMIHNQQEKTVEGGKTVTRYWLFDDASYSRAQAAAARRGERIVVESSPDRNIEFDPESFMPLDFLNSLEAKRTAAKVALTCCAAKLGQIFACSSAFDGVRRYISKGEGDSARLFFNPRFAGQTQAAPFHHVVILSCDARKHSVHAIVLFYGTMPYLVELSTTYEGIDFGAQYAIDGRSRKDVLVFAGNLENERLAIEDVIGGNTRFDDVISVAEHGAKIIKLAAWPREIRTRVPG